MLPIFSSKDIVSQLPSEEVLFLQVDALFRKTMQNVLKNPRVIDNAGVVCKIKLVYFYFLITVHNTSHVVDFIHLDI